MNTPEAAVVAYFGAWERRSWADMAAAVQTSRRLRLGDELERRLMGLFGNRVLIAYAVEDRHDLAPALTELRVRARWRIPEIKSGIVERILVVNVIHEDETGRPMARYRRGATWAVNETSALREVRP